MQEWIPSLCNRKKWNDKEKNIAKDDIVLLVSADTERGKWPLAKVVEVFPSNDGYIRKAKTLVNGKHLLIPIHKLVPIISE